MRPKTDSKLTSRSNNALLIVVTLAPSMPSHHHLRIIVIFVIFLLKLKSSKESNSTSWSNNAPCVIVTLAPSIWHHHRLHRVNWLHAQNILFSPNNTKMSVMFDMIIIINTTFAERSTGPRSTSRSNNALLTSMTLSRPSHPSPKYSHPVRINQSIHQTNQQDLGNDNIMIKREANITTGKT